MIPDFPIDIRIRLAELNFFCCFLTLLIFCPVGLLSFAETANRVETEQPQDATKKIQLGQSYSYIMRKVWYISSNLNSKLFRFHCVRPNLDINKKFNLFSPFLHPLSQLSTWGFPWSMNYRKGSNEHSLARSLKYQPCKNQNLGGNFLAVKSCASSSVGWGLEREHNGLKSFIFFVMENRSE